MPRWEHLLVGLNLVAIFSSHFEMSLLLYELSSRATSVKNPTLLLARPLLYIRPFVANATSSRSHAILEVRVERRDLSSVKRGKRKALRSRLFMIDLAGSERAHETQNTGQRMTEAQHINRSLLALGNCINSLGRATKEKYVNYRDSKLTRMLKDSLGGNCRTVMIACVSPAANHFEESHNTLTYAGRARNIINQVKENTVLVKVCEWPCKLLDFNIFVLPALK